MDHLVRHTGLVLARAVRAARRQLALTVLAPTLIVVFMVVIFDTLFGAIAQAPGWPLDGFVDWVTPGAVFLSVFVGAGFSAASLAEDLRSGYLDRLRLVGVHPAAHVGGRALFEGLRAVPPGACVLAAAAAVGAEVGGGLAGALGLVGLAALLAVGWNALFLLTALRSADPAAVVGMQPIFMPVVMFSTFWVPVAFMPAWYETVATINPFSLLVDAGRGLVLGTAEGVTVALVAAGLVTFAAGATAVAGRAYAHRLREDAA